MGNYVSEEPAAFIIKVPFYLHLLPRDGGRRFVQNIGNTLPYIM